MLVGAAMVLPANTGGEKENAWLPLQAESHLNLDEALELLGALEEARDALLTTDHLAEVAVLFAQVQRISRKLGFDPEGGSDAS